MGFTSTILGADNVPDFDAPELQKGKKYKSGYTPGPSGQAYDPITGAQQFQQMESELGLEGFDGDAYRAAVMEGMEAQTADAVRREQARAYDAAQSGGMGRSGAARALTQEARMSGDRTLAAGRADAMRDSTQMQLQEDAMRRGEATQIGQYGADYAEGLRRFNDDQSRFQEQSEFGAATFQEDQRRFDTDAEYAQAMDEYFANQVAPQQRQDQKRAALLQSGTDLAAAGISLIPTGG